MAEKVIKGVLNSKTSDDGKVLYKVRYAGMDKSADEWVPADTVAQEHVSNFEKRKAKKSAQQQSASNLQEEKKRKAESEPSDAPEEQAAEEDDEGEEGDRESKRSKLEYDEGEIAVAADEVDPSLIITGPRRKRAAAAKAQESSEWKGLLDGKFSELADSDSDSD